MLWSFICCIMTILSIPKTINLKLIKDNICLLFISIWSKLPFILSQKHIKFPVKSQVLLIYCLFNYPRPRPLLIVTPTGAKIGIPGRGRGPGLSLQHAEVVYETKSLRPSKNGLHQLTTAITWWCVPDTVVV